jgi:hypothetical protein
MWPFRRKSADTEKVIAVLDDTINIVAQKWRHFSTTLVFKEDVPLQERIAAFSFPMFEGIRKNVPELRKSPDAFLLIVVAKGIEKSGTHSRAEIEEALGAALPD